LKGSSLIGLSHSSKTNHKGKENEEDDDDDDDETNHQGPVVQLVVKLTIWLYLIIG